jgi:heme exporter protein B
MYYVHTLVSPQVFLFARLLFNGLFVLLSCVLSFLLFAFFIGTPPGNIYLFLIYVFIAGWGISSLLTFASAIAMKGGGGFALMAIISFPLLVPLLLVAQHLSLGCFTADSNGSGLRDIGALVALDAIIAALAYLLFAYLWRD